MKFGPSCCSLPWLPLSLFLPPPPIEHAPPRIWLPRLHLLFWMPRSHRLTSTRHKWVRIDARAFSGFSCSSGWQREKTVACVDAQQRECRSTPLYWRSRQDRRQVFRLNEATGVRAAGVLVVYRGVHVSRLSGTRGRRGERRLWKPK